MVPRETIAAMAQRIVERFSPRLIVLFGSHARGGASPDSDVDLLVVMPLLGNRLATAVAIRKVLRGFGVAKDIIVLTPEEFERKKDLPGTVAYPATREGVILHAA